MSNRSAWDNFYGIFTKDDGTSIFDKEEKKEEDGYTSTEILVILYTVLNSLILIFNLWIVVMVTFSKLRRNLYYLKIVFCSIGDLIFVVMFSFQIVSYLDPYGAWEYGELMCKISSYVTETHLFYIALALSSLCCDRILRMSFSQDNCFTLFFHIVLFLMPFVGAYIILIPVLESHNVVVAKNLTNADQMTYLICKLSDDYDNNKIQAGNVLMVLQNVIFVPSLCFLFIQLICFYKRREQSNTNTEIEEREQQHVFDQSDANNDTSMTSSSIAVIIVTVVTVVFTIPNTVLHFCSPECLPDTISEIKIKYTIIQTLFLLSLIPSVVRPFLWIFDVGIRRCIKSMFCCCCKK